MCQFFGITRQAYYKRLNTPEKDKSEEAEIISEVKAIRTRQPQIGGRKLLFMLAPLLDGLGIEIGRDRFFALLRKYNLLIQPRKATVRTTQSYHRFRTYCNLIKSLVLDRANQVFVADITYIRTLDGFCYLALITDAFSRRIVGFDVSDSLSIDGSLRALKMALRSVKFPEKLIHHSDRGIQYCSHAYVDLLKNFGVKISMTEKNHVYENSLAERVNGILKTEFMLGETLIDLDHAKQLVAESIEIYNNERPHLSLNYKTPNQVHFA